MKKFLFIILTLATVTIFNQKSFGQVPASDSLALVSLYNSTNGPGWTNSTNWLTGPVSTWYGVTVTSGRVTGIQLQSNGLSGEIPVEVINLSELVTFNISQNILEYLPSLSMIPSLTNLSIANNNFDFGDIEPNMGVASFVYSPQDSIGEAQLVVLNEGSSHLMSVSVGGENNVYQWYKNGTLIPGEVNDTIIISNVTVGKSIYKCKITNTVVTGLELWSKYIDFKVIPCIYPSTPVVDTIIQPTCAIATGSVELSSLPSGSDWVITEYPGGRTIPGNGTIYTVSSLNAGTYNYTVKVGTGCESFKTGNIVINAQPVTPSTPVKDTIIQPTCALATGSIELTGLPATGTWTLILNPGNIESTGTGTTTTLSDLSAGTYSFTVKNELGCTSLASAEMIVNPQPATPAVMVIDTIVQPSCALATGSVELSGLPSTGTWTITVTPGNATYTGTGTTKTISELAVGTYTFKVKNAEGCTSVASSEVVINSQPVTPAAPVIGTISQPTCALATGKVELSGLPSEGTWILSSSSGSSITGTGTSALLSDLSEGTYTFTVKNEVGCFSVATAEVVINAQPVTPAVPMVGTISQPSCSIATGSVELTGLPSEGTWTLTRTPGNVTTTGTGSSKTISELAPGTYTFTVSNASCTSAASVDVVINAQPAIPAAPAVGTKTQPSCAVATGSVELSGLPSEGTWTITGNPGNITSTGTGTSKIVGELAAGTYTFTVTNASGCTSTASSEVVINAQPATPETPVVTINENVLHSNATTGNQWYNHDGIIAGATEQNYTATATGNYYVIVSNANCSSNSSNIIQYILSGVEDSESDLNLKVYPNPVADELKIEIKGSIGITYFEIINSNGNVVSSGNFTETTSIKTSDLSSGIYLVKFENNNSVKLRRIVKY